MRPGSRHDATLTSIFACALASAASACTVPEPAPVTVPTARPTVEPATSGEAIVVDRMGEPRTAAPASTQVLSPQAYVRSFVGLKSLASAIPGAELLGFVEERSTTTCTIMPCPPEWLTLTANLRPAAIVKRNGKLESITGFQAPRAIGKIDSPEKAAVFVRLTRFPATATCGRVRDQGWACDKSGAESGIPVRRADGGRFEVMTFGLRNICPPGMYGNAEVLGVLSVDADGKVDVVGNAFVAKVEEVARDDGTCSYPVPGRRFEGFVDDEGRVDGELAYHLRAARAEAAAVHAFERLALELEAHAAPEGLVRDARRAADDERRHARAFLGLARRIGTALGVPVVPPEVGAPASFVTRSRVDLLVENAREGCANETLAAIVASHQAAHAPPHLRRVLGAIACDERRHADLAHRVHAWGLATLPPTQADLVERARRDALDALVRSAAPSSTAVALGEPSSEVALGALASVTDALVARAA